VGHEIVEANGGKVMLVDILEGFSTTSLVQTRGARGAKCERQRDQLRREISCCDCGAGRRPGQTAADIFAILTAPQCFPWSD